MNRDSAFVPGRKQTVKKMATLLIGLAFASAAAAFCACSKSSTSSSGGAAVSGIVLTVKGAAR